MATMQDYNEYTKEAINGIYDAQREKQLADLETAYNTNLATAEAAKGQIGQAYQEQRNNLANTYERTRRNVNEQAAASGLNVGTGSQAQLMQRSEYQRDNNSIGVNEANAMATAEQGITDLKTEYDQQLNRAQTLANYGDFTGFAAIYGQEQADNMRKAWIATNPDVAYNTGNISAEEYRAVTGVYPKGYTAPSSGGDYYYSGKKPKEEEETKESSLSPADVSRLVLAGYSVPGVAQYIQNNGGTHEDLQNAIKWATQMGAQTTSGGTVYKWK